MTNQQLPELAALRATLEERTRRHAEAEQALIDGQLDLLAATWGALERGQATWPDLYAVAEQMRAGNVGGWTLRWNEIVPMSWQKVQHLVSSGQAPPVPAPRRSRAEFLPGRWEVTRPPGGRMVGSYSHPGTYVVYELYDAEGELLYIGCTVNLANRLGGHSGKPWARCVARQAADKVDAEGLEAVEILTRQPPMNRQPFSYGGAHGLLTAARAASLVTSELLDVVAALHAEASAQAAAAAVEGDSAEFTGTPWSELVETDPAQAEWVWKNTVGNYLAADEDRVRQIVADRRRPRLAAVQS